MALKNESEKIENANRSALSPVEVRHATIYETINGSSYVPSWTDKSFRRLWTVVLRFKDKMNNMAAGPTGYFK